MTRAGTAATRASRTARAKGDIARAEERVDLLRERLAELEASFQEDVAPLQDAIDLDELECQPLDIAARKSDLEVERLQLIWLPQRAIIV